ncbi:MAG: peptidoglycan DD-metalloendopeptidase family protein [Streptosporangiales bacterium]
MKRPVRPVHALAALLAGSALLLGSAPAYATPSASSGQDPDKLRAKLSDLSDKYSKAETRVAKLDRRTDKVTRQVTAARKRLEAAREQVVGVAQLAYTSGGPVSNSVLAMLGGGDPEDVVDRLTVLAMMSKQNDAALKLASSARSRLDKRLTALADAEKSAKATQKKLKKRKSKLNAALLEAAREAAARANRGTSRSRGPVLSSGGACPIGSPYTVTDSFGAPRGGGRSHEGDDIMAPRNTPIYAVEDGTISRAYSNTLGGIAIILQGESGDSYYYAHQRVNLVHTGEHVVAGQQIAKVGMTGDAQGTVYHLHFERWPNGGSAVDPYPFVTALCGKKG